MRCPNCREDNHRVTDTRDTRRTRKCKECGHTWVTSEGYDIGNIMVSKRDGSTEPFSREKVFESIKKALVKRTPVAELNELVDQVISDLFARETLFFPRIDGESWADTTTVTTRHIGHSIMDVLQAKTRYRATRIRYALLFESANHAFKDAAGFAKWLQTVHPEGKLPVPAVPQLVVKRNGETVMYERDKLEDSIKFAIRKRPIDETDAKRNNHELVELLVREVERQLQGQRTVSTAQLALTTMTVLKQAPDGGEIDKLMARGERQLAYLRVASSAKRFTRIEDFLAEATYLASSSERVSRRAK